MGEPNAGDDPRGSTLDMDQLQARLVETGLTPDAYPQNAAWGERYFHITDPDGHELSFARRIDDER